MLMGIELEERIDRQKLDTCPCIEHVARYACKDLLHHAIRAGVAILERLAEQETFGIHQTVIDPPDRKSTRLNSSHLVISYAVFCLKKKRNKHHRETSRQEQ